MSKSLLLEFGGSFPWVKRHKCHAHIGVERTQNEHVPAAVEHKDKHWVILPDGRHGYVHHQKTDGKLGVRPITDDGEHYLNANAHWPHQARIDHPEEHALFPEQVRPAEKHELPRLIRGSR